MLLIWSAEAVENRRPCAASSVPCKSTVEVTTSHSELFTPQTAIGKDGKCLTAAPVANRANIVAALKDAGLKIDRRGTDANATEDAATKQGLASANLVIGA